MSAFLLRLALLSLLAVGGLFAWHATGHPLPPYAYELIAFYAGLTWLTHRVVELGRTRDPDALPVYYMAALGARLLLALAVAGVFIWTTATGRTAFLTWFFLLYFAYTALEVWEVVRNLRPISEKAGNAL